MSGAAAVRLAHGARRAAAALAVAAAALACAPAHPQEAVDRELRAERTVEAGRLQPGAPIRMTLRATAPAGATIRLPALDRTLGPFDVRDVRTLPAADGGAALEATLVGWDAGALELPEMKVEATLADGTNSLLDEHFGALGGWVASTLVKLGDLSLAYHPTQEGAE